jgi:glycosyltransferase involved in cell wall biosynthesis
MVTWRAAAHLQGALESIAAQAPRDCEVLIWDGGSDDGTQALITEHEHLVSRWWSAPDDGIYDAMERLIDRAQGRHIYFLGADDRLEAGFATAAGQLSDSNAVYYGDVALTSDGSRYDGPFDSAKLCLRNICHQAVFAPTALLRSERFDRRYRLLADHELNLRLWGKGIPFHWVDAVVARFNDGGASGGGEAAFERDRFALIRRHLGLLRAWWFRYRMTRNWCKRTLLGKP